MCYDHNISSFDLERLNRIILERANASEASRKLFESIFTEPRKPWEEKKEVTWASIGNYFKP